MTAVHLISTIAAVVSNKLLPTLPAGLSVLKRSPTRLAAKPDLAMIPALAMLSALLAIKLVLRTRCLALWRTKASLQ